jgi:hypothetical protein
VPSELTFNFLALVSVPLITLTFPLISAPPVLTVSLFPAVIVPAVFIFPVLEMLNKFSRFESSSPSPIITISVVLAILYFPRTTCPSAVALVPSPIATEYLPLAIFAVLSHKVLNE